jgi:hypothetical protein
MAFRATLNLEGKEVRILSCNYALQQDIDPTGRPSSEVRGGTIQFEVESTDDTSFYEWMIDAWSLKSGNIHFFKRDEHAKLKELKFEDAYIISYSENFDSTGDNPMTESFVISAKKIKMGNGVHENPWPI